ncbi:hypothetical protein V496_04799, partial [Pseudogymnoascus sp. VKM F-4515 (FW-2607)]
MKGKTSRDSLATANAGTPRSRDSSAGPQSKARKMLGMGAGGGTPPGTMYDDHPHPNAYPHGQQQQPRSHYDSDSGNGGGYASSTYDNNPAPPRSVPRSAPPPAMGGGGDRQQPPPGLKNFRDKRRDAQRERERQVLNRHRAGTGGGSDSDDYFGAAGRQQGPQMRGPQGQRPHGANGANAGHPAANDRHHHPAMRTRSPSRDAPPVSYRAPRAGSVESGHNSGGSRPGTRERSGSNASASGYGNRSGGGGGGGPRFGSAGGEGGLGGERGAQSQAPRSVPEGLATINSPSYPPPGVPFAGPGAGGVGNGAPSPRSRSGSRSQAQGQQSPFPGGAQGGGPMHLNLDAPGAAYSAANSPRPSPVVPFAVNSTPALVPTPSFSGAGASGPTTPLTPSSSSSSVVPGGSAAAAAAAIAAASAAAAASAQMTAAGGKGRKRSVNKRDISDPVFVSSTNKVSTVELPTSPVRAGGGGG